MNAVSAPRRSSFELRFFLLAGCALCLLALLGFATVALIQVYDKITQGQTPNPDWSAKLESMSGKFRELTQKARDFVTPAHATVATPTVVTSASSRAS